jgi:hypothetical protein
MQQQADMCAWNINMNNNLHALLHAQWATGIMVYQLLSGHLPFWDAGSDRSPFAVMSAILNQEVPPLLLKCQSKAWVVLCDQHVCTSCHCMTFASWTIV